MVSSAAQITTAMQSAQPGDILTMTDGNWTNQRIQFAGDGAAGAPITLRAQTPGQVVLNGNSKVNISGNWLVVDGLNFEGGALGEDDHIVEFRGSQGSAFNSRVTNTAIVDYNPASVDTRYFWVSLYGQNNRVDHNYFKGQTHSGVTVTVWRSALGPDYHQIDNNYFAERPAPINPADPNGFETIRIGTSTDSLTDSYTVVENNLFERNDGEIETISNKSGHNTYRYNTFRENVGTLTLRHGNDTLIDGNFFLGENVSNSGAIRVIGERQTIVNNYIESVDDRAGGAISISAGVPNSPLSGYYQVKDAVIAHNTLVNVTGNAVTFDDGLGSSGRTLLAQNVTFANNIFRSNGPAIFEGAQGTGWTWEGNIAFGGSLGSVAGNSGVTVVDPQLQVGADGLYRPGPASPAINGASGNYSSLLTADMDGQPRIGLYDIGADEQSAAAIVRRPLVAADVGPAWISDPPDPPPGGGGFFAEGFALQAEDFSALSDPNGDGDTWTVATVAAALGGEALIAPSGSIPAAGTQDAIASYDVHFQTAGTYRAYYRARGPNSSSDSIFVPSGLGVDPTVNESLSTTGPYRWEVGGTFVISAANVDVPLEFRIGKREQNADFDAFALHLDQSLTAAELDALFAPVYLEADFNQDGMVDAGDLAAWKGGFGATASVTRAMGDANDDDVVDGSDFLVWQRQLGSLPGAVAAGAAVPEPTAMAMLLLGGCLASGLARAGEFSHRT